MHCGLWMSSFRNSLLMLFFSDRQSNWSSLERHYNHPHCKLWGLTTRGSTNTRRQILTLASLSSLATASCSLTTHTYSLPVQERHKELNSDRQTATLTFAHSPAPCWDLTRRVARSMQTMRQPVTCGSSVPLWPVFSTRRMRRIHATTLVKGFRHAMIC